MKLLLLLFVCLLSHTVLSSVDTIRVQSKTFVDQFGRLRQFRGLNVVYKDKPFHPIMDHFDPNDSFCEQDARQFKEWGFNIARLFVSWEGTALTRDSFNVSYLEQIKKLTQIMEQEDIYVILDAHQDLGSSYFCGEGFPDWFTHQFLHNFPSPLFWVPPVSRDPKTQYANRTDCLKTPFFEYYLTKDVGTLFQALYENRDNIWDAFGSFWAKVAQMFYNQPNVLGYEILNEPWAGDIFSHPFQILLSGKVDKDFLAPMYEKIHEYIRKYDDKKLFFFEPMVSDLKEVGFQTVPGGKEYEDRSVFSYHVYCAYQDEHGDPKSRTICKTFDDAFFNWRENNHQKIGGGVILSEFGAVSNSTEGINELNWIMEEAEKRFHSTVYWQYKYYEDFTTSANPPTTESLYDENGELKVNKLKALSRTYVQALCASKLDIAKFNPSTAEYVLRYTSGDCQNQPTIVYLNTELYYPQGFNIVTDPPNAYSNVQQVNKNYLYLIERESNLQINLRIEAK